MNIFIFQMCAFLLKVELHPFSKNYYFHRPFDLWIHLINQRSIHCYFCIEGRSHLDFSQLPSFYTNVIFEALNLNSGWYVQTLTNFLIVYCHLVTTSVKIYQPVLVTNSLAMNYKIHFESLKQFVGFPSLDRIIKIWNFHDDFPKHCFF